jgi:hypothetical protein
LARDPVVREYCKEAQLKSQCVKVTGPPTRTMNIIMLANAKEEFWTPNLRITQQKIKAKEKKKKR